MAPDGLAPGAVNLYSTRRDGFGHSDRVLGEVFAMHVGVTVYGAHAVANLRRAVETRDVIGQGKGILMERFGLSSGAAFDLLVRTSQTRNVKVRDVAQWLVNERGTRARSNDNGSNVGPAPSSPQAVVGDTVPGQGSP
ncbi:MAG: ANTAR domain-containing protein [Pseudonocardia sp.]|nr:ANTAR domain-containing protein [Pseudonocardia sp.]